MSKVEELKEQFIETRCQDSSAVGDLEELLQAVREEERENFVVCPDCKGDGFTSEHDPNDPHVNGCTNCPIHVQCYTCRATGIAFKSEIDERNEKIQKEIDESDDDLPF